MIFHDRGRRGGRIIWHTWHYAWQGTCKRKFGREGLLACSTDPQELLQNSQWTYGRHEEDSCQYWRKFFNNKRSLIGEDTRWPLWGPTFQWWEIMCWLIAWTANFVTWIIQQISRFNYSAGNITIFMRRFSGTSTQGGAKGTWHGFSLVKQWVSSDFFDTLCIYNKTLPKQNHKYNRK
jgi:hypothetical protein